MYDASIIDNAIAIAKSHYLGIRLEEVEEYNGGLGDYGVALYFKGPYGLEDWDLDPIVAAEILEASASSLVGVTVESVNEDDCSIVSVWLEEGHSVGEPTVYNEVY